MSRRKYYLYVWDREKWTELVGGDNLGHLKEVMISQAWQFGRINYIYEIRRGDKVLHRVIIEHTYERYSDD